MEEYIQGLVNSVVNGRMYRSSDFTEDLPKTFEASDMDPRKEWYRYVEYRKAINLRNARNSYLTHHDREKLAEDFRIAYYIAGEEKKKFEK
jgi:hypothetical protein